MFGSFIESGQIIADLARYYIEKSEAAKTQKEKDDYLIALTALKSAHELLDIEERKCRLKYLEMMNGGPEDLENLPFDPRSLVRQ